MALQRQAVGHLSMKSPNGSLIHDVWCVDAHPVLYTGYIGSTHCCGSLEIGGHARFSSEYFLQLVKHSHTSIVLWHGYNRENSFGPAVIDRYVTEWNTKLEGVLQIRYTCLNNIEHLFLIETHDPDKFYEWQNS